MTALPFAPDCRWCWPESVSSGTPGFFLFRRRFTAAAPGRLRLRVSADNRYALYLDGVRLGRGPCRSDLANYRYETYDLALDAGRHVLSAEVVVYPVGFREEEGPWSEIHADGGFLVDGDASGVSLATPGGWRCREDAGRAHRRWRDVCDRLENTPYPAPPMEAFDVRHCPGDWRALRFDDSDWTRPKTVGRPCFRDGCETDPPSRWRLAPRTIPQMEERPTPIAAIPRSTLPGLSVRDGVLSGTVPTGVNTVLLDLGRNQTSMPRLDGVGGGGRCRIAYAEALYTDGKRGSRHPVPNAGIGRSGCSDLVLPSEGTWRFEPFWYRTGRFVELTFELDAPMTIEGLRFAFVGYPFERRVRFAQDGLPWLDEVFEVGWHTARCCAHEHYEDCPYWEQMQYLGDTRIQALISYAATGDRRLGRQALEHFDASRVPDGLTLSRYPTNYPQIIPQFSLFWVLMAGDYHAYFGDPGFLAERLVGLRAVMDWFERKRDPATGLVGPVGHWNITDWVAMWPGGKTSRNEPVPETLISLIYAEANRVMADLLATLGHPREARVHRTRRKHLLEAVNRHCRAPDTGLYQDVPGRDWYSQHVNAWAILADAAPRSRWNPLLDACLSRPDLARCTLYFAFYLMEAARKAGRDDVFEAVLSQWREPLSWGFTTFPECPTPDTRSDCHAWSAGPVYEIVRHYLGVGPATPDFGVVAVAPRPGSLTRLAGEAPVGDGRLLRVEWEQTRDTFALRLSSDHPLELSVTLPNGRPRPIRLAPGQPLALQTPAARRTRNAP